MKKIFLILSLFASLLASAQCTKFQIPANENPMYFGYGNFAIGCMLHTPPDAVKTQNGDAGYENKKYPIILFFHGIGERSHDATAAGRGNLTDVDQLYTTTPMSLLRFSNSSLVGKRYAAPGKTDSTQYFYLAPQCSGGFGYFIRAYPNAVIKYIKKHMSDIVDTNRIYITGLSFGGGACDLIVQDSLLNIQISAAAYNCPGYVTWNGDASTIGTAASYAFVARSGLPLWLCHAYDDDQTDHGDPTDASNGAWYSLLMVRSINSYNPRYPPKFFWYANGPSTFKHNVWDRMYNPATASTVYPLRTGENVGFAMQIQSWFCQFNTRQPRRVNGY